MQKRENSNSIGNKKSQPGFTIVELLIVIVVIAILATITIVSYTGVQSRARATKAKMNAATVQKVAEAYYAEKNVYPTTVSQFRSALISLPSDIQILTSGGLGPSNGEDTVVYKYVSGGAGACVYYWDFAPASGGAAARSDTVLLGTATATTCSPSAGASPTP